MGRALIGGLLRSGTRAEMISAGEAIPAARQELAREFGITATPDNAQAIAGAEAVVLAVKPQDAARVVTPLAPVLAQGKPLLISVCAGTQVDSLRQWSGGTVPVVRAMPNRPALVGAGVTGLYAPVEVTAARRELAQKVMQAVGEVVWVPTEAALDAVTALSGSGPAYFFLLAQLMAEAGTRLGLAPAAAQRLASATLYGSGMLANTAGADLARLRAEVTSPGGTTEAALRVLDQAGLAAIIEKALGAAAARSRELGAQRPDPDPAGRA